MTYFKNIHNGVTTVLTGMGLTIKHFWEARNRNRSLNVQATNYFEVANGMTTFQYPHEVMPMPDHGRNKLHNEMDDCIVCDKCAKICPVDCIEIEPIKATEEVGRASDGSPIRLYAAKFDIDMAKCCYCGLCTTVCPTECLTMTNEIDYSTFDVRDMLFQFGNLTPQAAEEKRQLWEQYQQEKEAAKITKTPPTAEPTIGAPKRPVFKPKPLATQEQKTTIEETTPAVAAEPAVRPKPVFVPKKPPVESIKDIVEEETTPAAEPAVRPKPVFVSKKPKE
jgi:formate hydrogenlyase subunit 6/NADH:ubiquinone oxidoreductase subunit I